MEYKAVIVNIPHSRFLILSPTFKNPVNAPAAQPDKNANIKLSHGSIPAAETVIHKAAPSGKVPSTERSGKSKIL